MKERPILFQPDMVRALLDGRKTQTRRTVKPQPPAQMPFAQECGYNEGRFWWNDTDEDNDMVEFWPGYECDEAMRCPCGQPGDRLWVRENFRIGAWRHSVDLYQPERFAIDYRASPELTETPWLDCVDSDMARRWMQQSLDDAIAACQKDVTGERHWRSGERHWRSGDRFLWEKGDSPCRWRPSIHMPRFASRLTLEIKTVRLERLQDITEEDAIAEGITKIGGCEDGVVWKDYGAAPGCWRPPVDSFRTLWASIHGPGTWDANPWVWVVEFWRLPNP